MLSRLGFVYFSNNSFYVLASYQKKMLLIFYLHKIFKTISENKNEKFSLNFLCFNVILPMSLLSFSYKQTIDIRIDIY